MVEKQPYQVERSLGESMELRRYPAHRVVSVDVRGGIEEAGNLGFGPLVGYISGANASRQKIAMTAPVLQEESDGHHRVSFVLPQDWWDRQAPAPLGDQVRIEDRPAEVFAAITFRGGWREEKVRTQETVLRDTLQAQGIQATGPAVYARYDPPSVPGIFRRNEVLIPVSAA